MSKAKVLLVYPNTPMATLLPIGVASLSACLKQAGFDVALFDTTYYETDLDNFEKRKEHLLQVKPFDMGVPFKEGNVFDDFAAMVNDYQPDVIGVSVVEDTIPLGLDLLHAVRHYNPNVPRVAGGVGATFNKGRLFDSGFVDAVFVGEAEHSIVDFINGKFGSMKDKYKEVGPFEPVDINTLPYPDFTIFEPDRIKRAMFGTTYRMLHVELDRGCPYNCTYCCSPALKEMYGRGYYRTKDNGRLLEEIKWLNRRWFPDYIDFNSETLLARPPKQLGVFLWEYARSIEVPFWCQSRPETISGSKLKALKMGGVADMQFGIEHGDEDFRRKWLNRNASNDTILRGLAMVEKVGIPYTVNNIIGWPMETREQVFRTIEFNKLINPKTMNVYMLAPYKGTWIRKYCEDEGLMAPTDSPDQLLGGVPGMKYQHMSHNRFLGLQRCFPLYVKMPELEPLIRLAENVGGVGNTVFERLRDIYIARFYS